MKRIPVDSTSMLSVGYDEVKKILEVEFPTGTIYHYLKVPVHKFLELIKANSIGIYFNSYIKPLYKYKRIK